jgi:hypothetical protein
VLAGLLICAIAPFSDAIFGVDLTAPLLVASVLPILYSVEGTAAAALLLRGRYDVRAFFLFVSMALRLVALVVGAQYGVTETVVALVLAQLVATAVLSTMGLVALLRFPRVGRMPLAQDRSEIVRFVLAVEPRHRASSRSARGSRRSCSASSARSTRSGSFAPRRRRSRAWARSAHRCG